VSKYYREEETKEERQHTIAAWVILGIVITIIGLVMVP